MKKEIIKSKKGGKRENSGRKATGRKDKSSLAFRLKDWQKQAIKTEAEKNGQTVREFVLSRCLV